MKRGELNLSLFAGVSSGVGTYLKWGVGFNCRNALGIGIASLSYSLVANNNSEWLKIF